jgi:hypothetical protein
MEQIITLLTNLFNLTKVASVTLPGLLAAAGLALTLWPAIPIDVIPVVTAISTAHTAIADNAAALTPSLVKPSREPSSESVPGFPPAFDQACSVSYWPADEAVSRLRLEVAKKNKDAEFASPRAERGPALDASSDQSWVKSMQTQLEYLERIEQQGKDESVPESRKRAVREQFLLDFEAHNLALCLDLEKSWQGQEERDIQLLTADADILEKQRSAAQDNYLAYQKSNNPLAAHYEADMDTAKARIDTVRNTIRGRNRTLQERTLKINELNEDQQIIVDRLKDPGRLRPRVGFDAFLTGLVNHIVGFILLSLAAAIVVTAIDRAAFGAFFEDLFDGF